MESFSKFMNSPVGPKTVHFWGPACNWALVLAAMADANKPPENISRNVTAVLMFYSMLFMRFAWRVQPRNLLLLSCHTANAGMQSFLLKKKMIHEWYGSTSSSAENTSPIIAPEAQKS